MIQENYGKNHYQVIHTVAPSEDGMRLDHFLKIHYRKRSREQIKDGITSGSITLKRNQSPHLNLGKVKPSMQLFAGDEVFILSERKDEPPVDFNYSVLFEDDFIFVISKPANLPVHPAGRYFFNTLLTHLRTGGHQRPMRADQDYYLPHRIDKETSGVLCIAKNKEVCASLTEQFSQRQTEKRYLAIVKGIAPETFECALPLKKATFSRIELKMATSTEEDGGLSAYTRFVRREVAGQFSLVECFPKTGRQHQIRVHLEAMGHPIVGDKLYGIEENAAIYFYERMHVPAEIEEKLLMPRHCLHAAELEFTHPITLEKMSFEAPLPADFRSFLDQQKAGTFRPNLYLYHENPNT